jgi:hypothetical protein
VAPAAVVASAPLSLPDEAPEPPRALALEPIDRPVMSTLEQPAVNITATKAVSPEAVQRSDGALPFRKGSGPPPPMPADDPESHARDHGETAELGMLSPLAKMALPFRLSAKSTPPPSAAVAPSGTAPSSPSVGPSNRPAAAPSASAPSPPAPSAPAGPPGQQLPAAALPSHLKVIALEHYAAIQAQCDATPQWAAQILLRYHVQSPDERALLDRYWRPRLATDPALAEAYRRYYAEVEQWLKKQRPS